MNNFANSSSPSAQQQQYNRGRSETLPTSFFSRSQLAPTAGSASNNNYFMASSLTDSPININEPGGDLLGVPKEITISTSPLSNPHRISGGGTGSNFDSLNHLQTPPANRVRSGSLFSSNSIWNDEMHTSNGTSLNSDSSGNFLTPPLDSTTPSHQQQSFPAINSSRNRSYTMNVTPHLAYDGASAAFAPMNAKADDMNSLLDSYMSNSRNRSQTVSGSIPGASFEINHNGYQSSQSAHFAPVFENEDDLRQSQQDSKADSNLLHIITKLAPSNDLKKIHSIINKCAAYHKDQYQEDFGPLPDPIPQRQFDSPTLRDLRKLLESKELGTSERCNDPNLSTLKLDELALAMLDELPEICYDYLGNTIVQKLFTLLDDKLVKLMMVKEVAPYLTQLGCHKNGTYAVQKIISLSQGQYQQMYLIGASLKPYAIKLFNDQFGNYVIQGCIKFGSPYNDFVFEAILDNFLQISFGRYGARCIRTILESSHVEPNANPVLSNDQIVLVASLIVQHAEELVVNPNGSLLITWYLDTFNDCEFKVEMLTNCLLPQVKHLCVHKLANLTVLKLLNNRSDERARRQIIEAIFQDPKSLEFILQENDNSNLNAGPVFIFKVLSNPILAELAAPYLPSIKRILMEINIVNFHNYKKLMDEVGLSSSRFSRNSSKRGTATRRNRGRYDQNQVYVQKQYPQSTPPESQQYLAMHPPPFQYLMNPPPPMYMMPYYPPQADRGYISPQQMSSQDLAVMQQLEQLSMSSAALGYNSNPGTPTMQRNSYI
ncbi:uncharacterized protein LODBEIA_P53140 [Lodderomyces beijingensis]|uniref:PUM-HD domain-containing protein n=1 Tax=Lodderomyces beijingensis TaxID=1775926 RepID=A0ABP0ZV40_9ASCO